MKSTISHELKILHKYIIFVFFTFRTCIIFIPNVSSSVTFIKLNTKHEPCNQNGLIVPFHAQISEQNENNQCTWKCKNGYFSTKSSSSKINAKTISVCKKCTTYIECPVGFQLSNCSFDEDVKCIPCPTLKDEGKLYSEGPNCKSTSCKEGYIHQLDNNKTYEDKCTLCPENNYCMENRIIPCPKNCSTNGFKGVFSPLACVQDDKEEASIMSLQMTLILPNVNQQQSLKSTKCSNLDVTISSWIQHGNLHGCSIDFVSTSYGVVKCVIYSSPCTNLYYSMWLKNKFAEKKTEISYSVWECLKLDSLNEISVGNPIIEISQTRETSFNTPSQNLIQRTILPSNPPKLIIEPKNWYSSSEQILLSIALFLILIICLFMALVITCSACVLKIQRNSILQKLYQKLANNRTKYLV